MRLIDADALKEALEQGEGFSWDSYGKDDLCVRKKYIDNAPTVELDESVIQEVLNKRCMTAVTNEYLIALHGKRPQGEWKLLYKGDEGHAANYECSICQREIYFDAKTESLTDYPFCHCGAEMRGGAE